MKYIHSYTLFLIFIFHTSCVQNQANVPKANINSETKDKATSTGSNEKYHTKYVYTDSNGKNIIIKNSYPKGGMKYIDPDVNVCGYAVFWTRLTNETASPLEVKINFPINSYAISNFPGKYFKVLVPADTMTVDHIPLFGYGLTDLDFVLHNNIHKPCSLKRNINPKESSGFYFLMLILTEEPTGMTRTGLTLKGQDLFYKISRYSITKPISLIDEKEIYCGSINLKNLRLTSFEQSASL